MSEIEIPAGVGWTALLTAYGRAQESRKANRLFDDPLAAVFIEAVGSHAGGSAELPRLGPAVDDDSSTLWNAFRFYFSQRTPFYDYRIQHAVGTGCRQIVLLGAGLDSRAFRLGFPADLKFFELDQAPVLDFKQEVLLRCGAFPNCQRIPLAVDLRTEWGGTLSAAGFDPGKPTVWVAEGLLMYLSRAEADLLLDKITALSAPGSHFAGEYFSRAWQDADVASETLDGQDWAAWNLVRSAFRYGPIDDSPMTWLASHGWTHVQTTTVAAAALQDDRDVPPEFSRPGAPQVLLFDGGLKMRAETPGR